MGDERRSRWRRGGIKDVVVAARNISAAEPAVIALIRPYADVARGSRDLRSVQPPANSDADFNLVVTATSTEGAGGSASVQQTLNVTINAVADDPSLTVQAVSGDENTAIDFTGLSASLNDTDGSETLSVTIAGVPAGAKVFDKDGAKLTVTNGEVTVTDPAQLANLDDFSVQPPANNDANFNLTVTATSTEGAGGSASVQQTLNVTVNAVADDPSLTVQAVSGDEDTAIDFTGLSASLNDTDGSETLSVTIAGIPGGAKVFDKDGAELTVTNGEVTVTDPAQLANLDDFSVQPPANSDADFNLTVTATSTEGAGGSASVQQFLNVTVNAAADDPGLTVQAVSGDEDTAIDFTGLSASLNDTDVSETLSVTIAGIPGGAKVFDKDGTELTVTNGEVTVTDPAQLANLDDFSVQPFANSDVDFNLTVTATSGEAAGGSASVQQTLNVTVNAVADDPNITVNDQDGGVEDQWIAKRHRCFRDAERHHCRYPGRRQGVRQGWHRTYRHEPRSRSQIRRNSPIWTTFRFSLSPTAMSTSTSQ